MAETKEQLEAILAGPDAKIKREVLTQALKPDTPEYRIYRAYADLNLEDDLERHLGLFEGHPLATDDLRKLRRGVMRRYAWGLGCQLTRKLKGERRARLMLDFLLPRVGLALLVGYGALLGAGDAVKWLMAMSRNHWVFWPALALSSVCVWLLVRLNVHRWLGREEGTRRRSLIAWAGCHVWAALGVLLVWALSQAAGTEVTAAFEWRHAILSGSVALLLAILGQFFFGGGGSMADPL